MTGHKKGRAALVAGAMMLCVPATANAQAVCWTPTQVAAAKVRDLQSRLMVATLRCSAMGTDVTAAYNRFISANRTTIQRANAVLLGQFQAVHGRQGQLHYDRFATALANFYGDDPTSGSVCAETAALADEAVRADGDIETLIALSDRLGFTAALPGGRCAVTFAEGR